jgi:hypothetical protein
MQEVRTTDILLRSLDKELVIYCYDYERDEVKNVDCKISLWSLIVIMHIIINGIKGEKIIEKLESIINKPKILVVFVSSLKKIFYIWLKEYDLHCRLLIKLFPELYNPKMLLKRKNTEVNK